jgi:hypothetical protein
MASVPDVSMYISVVLSGAKIFRVSAILSATFTAADVAGTTGFLDVLQVSSVFCLLRLRTSIKPSFRCSVELRSEHYFVEPTYVLAFRTAFNSCYMVITVYVPYIAEKGDLPPRMLQ